MIHIPNQECIIIQQLLHLIILTMTTVISDAPLLTLLVLPLLLKPSAREVAVLQAPFPNATAVNYAARDLLVQAHSQLTCTAIQER